MIPSKHSHLHVAVTTHPGMKGKNNEDRYAVSAFNLDAAKRIPSVVAVLSDGIGGHRAGEVAAEIVVEKISQIIAQSDASQPLLTLQQAITEASLAVRTESESEPSRKGMGATCACAWVIGNRLYLASVGDSRIYLRRGEAIHRLTTDHTWIQEALEQGVLTPDQARGHPNAHVIRRYLGSQQPAEADFRIRLSGDEDQTQAQSNQGLQLVPGDILLLCSDGLTDLVEDVEIQNALQRSNLDESLQELVDLANQRGGHDNITMVALKMPVAKTARATLPPARDKRPQKVPVLLISFIVGGSLLALAALGFAGFYFFWPDATPTPTRTPPRLVTTTFTITPQLSGTPAATLGLTPTGSVTPLSPPAPRVTRTLITRPPLSAPTYTPWPTNTGLFIDFPTATITPFTED